MILLFFSLLIQFTRSCFVWLSIQMSISFSQVELQASLQPLIGKLLWAVRNDQDCSTSPPSKYKQTKWCVPMKFERFADRIRNFEIRKDDVWVLGFMKSGTTWMQNIVWQLKNDFDFTASAVGYLNNLFELSVYNSASTDTQFDCLDAMPSPRIIKSHLPAPLLPKQLWTVRPKIIYTARNPKDVAVSLGHFMNALRKTNTPIETVFEAILNDIFLFAPLNAHVLSFWELRNDTVLFIKYEDLLADEFKNMKRIAEFLECSANVQKIKDLVDHVSFENMKPKIGMVTLDGDEIKESGFRFCRKGKAGSYRDDMTDEWIKRFNEWTLDQLKDSEFSYENV